MRKQKAVLAEYFASTLEAKDITDVNIAAGEAQQALAVRRPSIVRIMWGALLAILLSDLVPIGPLELGLIPDIHLFQWTIGQPWSHDAGRALYHVDPETPHFLGVVLPWGKLF